MNIWGSKPSTILAGLVITMSHLAENFAYQNCQFTLRVSKGSRNLPWELSETKSSSIVIAPSSSQDILEYTCIYSGKKHVAVGSNETLFRLALEHLWCLDDISPGRIYCRSMDRSGPDWEDLQNMWPSGRVVIQKERHEDLNHPDILTRFPKECQQYAERMVKGIDENFIPEHVIRNYVSEHFGVERTNELLLLAADDVPPLSESDIVLNLKQLAVWFREHFPYYHGSCDYCQCGGDKEKIEKVYLGQMCASDAEDREGGARRTELYLCTNCNMITRFPRYRGLRNVMKKRRGRCGEYSVLMFRMLQALGYDTRWVVDWGDHCWVEVLVNGRWLHVDPCEAVVDQPSLYESWNKNLTFCVAYSLNPTAEAVDVTCEYCTDMKSARLRRGISSKQMNQLLQKATNILNASNGTAMADVTDLASRGCYTE